MDVGIGLHPLAKVAVGNLVAVLKLVGRHGVVAEHLAFLVGRRVAFFELDGHAASARLHVVRAIFFAKAFLEGVQDLGGRFAAPVAILFAEAEEDIDILERLCLGMPGIGAGQEVALDVEAGPDALAYVVVTADRVLLLRLAEFEALAEFLKGFFDGDHRR